jgi:hypothetical protein
VVICGNNQNHAFILFITLICVLVSVMALYSLKNLKVSFHSIQNFHIYVSSIFS